MKFGLIKSFLIYTLPVLLVLITPFIWSDNLYNGLISAKQIWFYGAMALLILAFGIDLLFRRKNVSLRLNIIDIALLVFYSYFFIRAVFTLYTPLLYNTRFLNYTLLILFYFIVKYAFSYPVSTKESGFQISRDVPEKREAISSSEIIVIVLILTGLVQAVWGLLQLYGVTRSFHSGFKITGTFFNPAPYALSLAAIFPIALGNLLLNSSSGIRKFTYYISLLTVISIILVLLATMNRASWLGAFAGSVLILNFRYNILKKAKECLNSPAKRMSSIAIVILLIGCSGTGLYFLKKGSSEGRLLIWVVTVSKIAEKPLFGDGVGRFEAEYNNWQATYFKTHPEEVGGVKGTAAGNTKYCFNEYLEMGSETGIVGLFLFLVFTGTIVYYAFRKFKSHETQFSGYFLYLLSAFISLLVMAMISFPFYSLPTLIVFFFLTAIISSNVTSGIFHVKEKIAFNLLRFHRFLLFLVLVPFSFLLLIFSRQQFKTYYTFDEAVKLYQAGGYAEACKSFSEIYNPLQYTGSYLQYYGKALYLNEEFAKSKTMLEQAGKFTTDDILYCSLGDSYKACKMIDKAEESYRFASFMVPHKLYPLYLLANLYTETGQEAKAYSLAEELLNKKIKVESTATEEIRQAMRMIIDKIKNGKEEFNSDEQIQIKGKKKIINE